MANEGRREKVAAALNGLYERALADRIKYGAGLAADPGDYTAEDVAKEAGVSESQAKADLVALAKAGRVYRRVIRTQGRGRKGTRQTYKLALYNPKRSV